MTGKRGNQRSPLVVGGEPRVELMPPEVAQRERSRSLRNLGVLTLVAVILLVAGGYFLATTINGIAQQGLTNAQSETARILAEQQEYNSVTVVADLIALIEEGQGVARSTEVDWLALASELGRVMPPSVGTVSASVTGRDPWEPPVTSEGSLQQPKVAVLVLTLSAASIPELTSAVRAIEGLDSVADATLESITTGASLEAKVTVSLNENALTVNQLTEGSTPTPTPTPAAPVETEEEVSP